MRFKTRQDSVVRDYVTEVIGSVAIPIIPSALVALVLFTAAGHTEAEWDSIVARMEAKGTPASADDIDAVIAYLAKALPPR